MAVSSISDLHFSAWRRSAASRQSTIAVGLHVPERLRDTYEVQYHCFDQFCMADDKAIASVGTWKPELRPYLGLVSDTAALCTNLETVSSLCGRPLVTSLVSNL